MSQLGKFVLCFGLLIALLATGSASAQVFWSVKTPEGRYNWLLGTLHSEDERLLDFPPVLRQALATADTVALELFPDERIRNRLEQAMRLPDDEALDDHLKPRLCLRTLEALAEFGVPRDQALRLRPWAAAMTLSQPPPRAGVFMDLAIAARAQAHGARTVALETLDEQLALFTGMSKTDHVRLLELALDDLDHVQQRFERLVEIYLDGDLDALAALAREQIAALDATAREHFIQIGLIERNRRMAERARPLLNRGETLIAVGALHLGGEHGLIQRFRDHGFIVEAIY